MRVVCDNCGASYKIPDSKLTREVNKATCRKCGNPILIRRPDAAQASPAAAPSSTTDERTLITSAAELERQARARASNTYDEGAMDPRPTQVSPDNSHTEATVPRDEEAERAAAGFRPVHAPSEANTFVHGSRPAVTLIPDMSSNGMGLGAPQGGFGTVAPTQQVPGPLPAPGTPGVSPQRAAAAYQHPSPPPPFGRAAQAPPPPPAPPRAPTPTLAPAALPPVLAPATPSLVSPTPARAAHNPSSDLTFALLFSLASVFGVLLVIANSLLGVGAVAAFGTFLALLGSVGSALVVLTSARGTKPASIVLSGAGGFFLAVIGAASQGVASYGTVPSLVPQLATAAVVTPPPPVAPVEVVPPPAPPVDPLAALASEPVAEVVPPPPELAPVAAAPVTAPAPKPAPPPERIAPRPVATPAPRATAPSTPKSSGSSSRSTSRSAPAEPAEPAPAPKASGLDTRVIDTMIKNNKGVKKCFIVEKGNSGSIPSGVKVKLTVQTSGTVSSARIPSGDWAGTDFDGCVSGAVKAIQFPPFEGDSLTITYPFPT